MFYLVESQVKFERVTAEEDKDDGDEDDCQIGLSLLSGGVVHSIPPSTSTSTSDGSQSDGQIDPDVEVEESKPGDQDRHKQLQVLSWWE